MKSNLAYCWNVLTLGQISQTRCLIKTIAGYFATIVDMLKSSQKET